MGRSYCKLQVGYLRKNKIAFSKPQLLKMIEIIMVLDNQPKIYDTGAWYCGSVSN